VNAAPGIGRFVATLTTGPDRPGEHTVVTICAAALALDPFWYSGSYFEFRDRFADQPAVQADQHER
jgi:hypothetical protein